MKNLIIFCLFSLLFASCGESWITYRVRTIQDNTVVLTYQAEIKGYDLGDTVQLSWSDAYQHWSIDRSAPYLYDTSYVGHYREDSVSTRYYLVKERRATIEKIIK